MARQQKRCVSCRSILFFIAVSLIEAGWCREIDMKPHWDEHLALENPHKGWYHHFPDNHVNKYIIANDSDLTDFPGMDHLYIRLAWAYPEPLEGQFNWEIIDQLIEKLTAKGLGIAFRISCRETSSDRAEQQYATPRWVMEAGAKGDYYRDGERRGADGPWEPVYDDPIFLEKLANFLRAFAARYDGQPWLRYVDIGSIGDWGEGHTHSGSRLHYNYDQRKLHIDLHLKYFRTSQLVVADDFVYSIANLRERQMMHQYILDNGITYRDDSILVNYYVGAFPATYTVRSPEYFAAVYRQKPTVFELEHYATVKRQGNWLAEPGSPLAENGNGATGADFFRGALALLHATYIGYHGYAQEWLADNPQLSIDLLNRCGYWYFLHSAAMPDSIAGDSLSLTLAWENRGVAPAYFPYDLVLRLDGPETFTATVLAGNEKWLPIENMIYKERYTISLPQRLPGDYTLSVKLYSNQAHRTVFLALDPSRMDADHFYEIGQVRVLPLKYARRK
ncbi:DUF4832 domain-containing protein [candidate division KSB1 bacterium]|nr:DUF4832 domain-containing protein [candidate division KSB1 bacterium]